MKLKMLYSFLNTDAQLIEKELEAAIQAESPVLREASLHLLQSGENEFAQFLYCWLLSLATMIFM